MVSIDFFDSFIFELTNKNCFSNLDFTIIFLFYEDTTDWFSNRIQYFE